MEVREPDARYLKPFQRTELGEFPSDWKVVPLRTFEPFITSGSRGWAAFYADLGSIFLRITNLSRSCIYPSLQDLRYVAVPPENSEGVRTALMADDVLISITADIGIVGLVTEAVDLPAYINQHIALVRFAEDTVNSRYIAYFLAGASAQRRFKSMTDAGAKAGMNLGGVGGLLVAIPPTTDEQVAIAQALSDVDALIAGLEKLIAKKRDLKQAAMQQLLTGQTRLPGFSGEWVVKALGDIANIKTGSRNNEDKVEDGFYPFFVRSAHVERINSYSHECEAILVPGEGQIGEIFHYINGRFDVHQRVYAITQFVEGVSGKYIHLYMSQHFGAWAMQNTVKATVDSLRLPTFQTFQVQLPPTVEEQAAIAQMLFDLDAELLVIEMRLSKTRELKQGMMQELLTGRTRLIKANENE